MKNSINNIGSRIKSVRLQRQMTQNELCGTELTRNHLSLIESGKSLPSIKTICYIAERLDIPIGFLFSDNENEDASFANYFIIDEIRTFYTDRDYQKVITLCETIPQNMKSDEISYLYAMSLYAYSFSFAERFEFTEASNLMKNAAKANQNCLYLSKDFLKATDYYQLLFTSVTSDVIPQVLYDLHEVSTYVPCELIMYHYMLTGNKIDDSFFTNLRLRQHAEAINLRDSGDVKHAFSLLLELSELSSLPYYMKYRVFNDLEICAEEIGEYKVAYSAARFKLELINKH